MHGICFENPLQEWFDLKFLRLKLIQITYTIVFLEENFNTKPNAKSSGQAQNPW